MELYIYSNEMNFKCLPEWDFSDVAEQMYDDLIRGEWSVSYLLSYLYTSDTYIYILYTTQTCWLKLCLVSEVNLESKTGTFCKEKNDLCLKSNRWQLEKKNVWRSAICICFVSVVRESHLTSYLYRIYVSS